jgi:hypothetical protein
MISQIPPSLPPSLFVHANFTGREAEPNRHDARSPKMLASLAPIAMTPLTPSGGVLQKPNTSNKRIPSTPHQTPPSATKLNSRLNKSPHTIQIASSQRLEFPSLSRQLKPPFRSFLLLNPHKPNQTQPTTPWKFLAPKQSDRFITYHTPGIRERAQVWIFEHVDGLGASCARTEAQREGWREEELGLCCSHGQMEAE